jgi:hypothetical protein
MTAAGLHNLTNIKAGDFYGVTMDWTQKQRLDLGAILLYRAFRIYLEEGESQLRPEDLNSKGK